MEKDRAQRLFIEVSAHYPASVIAQAASVAITCRNEADTPEGLSTLLDHQTLLKLLFMADKAHSHLPEERRFTPPGPKRISGVILNIQEKARLFLDRGLSETQLTSILDAYRGATELNIRGMLRERLLNEFVSLEFDIDFYEGLLDELF
ncbi:MAG: hypothetical protein ACMG6E_03605 [Candidatus Roizmanbacteria bacterium]